MPLSKVDEFPKGCVETDGHSEWYLHMLAQRKRRSIAVNSTCFGKQVPQTPQHGAALISAAMCSDDAVLKQVRFKVYWFQCLEGEQSKRRGYIYISMRKMMPDSARRVDSQLEICKARDKFRGSVQSRPTVSRLLNEGTR